jgi:glutamate racemase
MIEKNIDCIVLGCTHYHFLIPIIREIIPKKIKIIDSGEAVALQTKNILKKNSMVNSSANNPYNKFYTNGKIKTIAELMNWDKSKIELLKN